MTDPTLSTSLQPHPLRFRLLISCHCRVLTGGSHSNCHRIGQSNTILHFRISESIIRFNRSTSIKLVRIAILTISAKVFDVIKKGVSVCTSVRSTHMRPCDFQRKRHAASGIATVLQFMDSFYEYSSFLGLCHMNQPFLKTPRRSNFWLFRNPKSSGILGNFGFLESQKFDRRGVFKKG